ncbi:hypothetical protein A2U01_0072901, partial [Trifolium medium]|nr:hypothetical protein [Trifolium medium]
MALSWFGFCHVAPGDRLVAPGA